MIQYFTIHTYDFPWLSYQNIGYWLQMNLNRPFHQKKRKEKNRFFLQKKNRKITFRCNCYGKLFRQNLLLEFQEQKDIKS